MFGIPQDAKIYVQIPGGGDYSNEALDVTTDCPVIIEWETRDA